MKQLFKDIRFIHVFVLSDGQGHSYDLSSLAMETQNWEIQPSTEDTKNRMYINVCRSLVRQGGPCPSSNSTINFSSIYSPKSLHCFPLDVKLCPLLIL